MVYRWVAPWLLVGLTLLGLAASAGPAWAETLSQSTLDNRVALAFRVKAEELQRLVPAPWKVAPVGTGASKDANLTMTFLERVLNQGADGKPTAVATYRLVGLSTSVTHPQTGESAPMIMRLFNSSPQEVPGFYKTAVQATVRREQTLKGVGVEPGTVTDWWEMKNGSGGNDRVEAPIYPRHSVASEGGE